MELFQGESFDRVITLCAEEAENCPVWLGEGEKFHRAFDDPFAAQGTEEQKMAEYRRVLREIQQQLPHLLAVS